MPKWAKWILIGAMVIVPTAGFAVTKYRAHHRVCPISPDCPCNSAQH